jgi:hypothetical protein
MVWLVYANTSAYSTTAAANTGGLYSSWAPVAGAGQIGQFSAPTRVGGTIPTIVYNGGGNNRGRGQEIAIGPTGTMMVAWDRPQGPGVPDSIVVATSTDYQYFSSPLGNGPTFRLVTTTNVPASGLNPPAAPAATPGFWTDIGLAWGSVAGTNQGVVYLVYTDRATVNANDFATYIMCCESRDGGETWTTPFQVSGATNNSQFLPAVSVDPTTGDAAVVWYDTRNDAVNAAPGILAQLYGTVIQGATGVCGPPPLFEVQISTGQSDASLFAAEPFGYGDYIGVAYYDGVFIPAWADNSNSAQFSEGGGSFDVYTARVTVNGPPQT